MLGRVAASQASRGQGTGLYIGHHKGALAHGNNLALFGDGFGKRYCHMFGPLLFVAVTGICYQIWVALNMECLIILIVGWVEFTKQRTAKVSSRLSTFEDTRDLLSYEWPVLAKKRGVNSVA